MVGHRPCMCSRDATSTDTKRSGSLHIFFFSLSSKHALDPYVSSLTRKKKAPINHNEVSMKIKPMHCWTNLWSSYLVPDLSFYHPTAKVPRKTKKRTLNFLDYHIPKIMSPVALTGSEDGGIGKPTNRLFGAFARLNETWNLIIPGKHSQNPIKDWYGSLFISKRRLNWWTHGYFRANSWYGSWYKKSWPS